MAVRVRENGSSTSRRYIPGPELRVQADARRLEQVFTNLLSNAIKYNRAGGQVQLSCEREGDADATTKSQAHRQCGVTSRYCQSACRIGCFL